MTGDSSTELRGRVLTMDQDQDASSVLITGNVIEAVGRHDRAAHTVLDFGDRVIMPGFLDGHAHIEVGSVAAYGVDCRNPQVTSIDEVIDVLRDNVFRAEERGGWLVAQSQLFMDQKLRDGRLPTRHDLDKASTDVAIVIRAGGHVSCLNSKAIETSGLSELPPSSLMGGPVVERDERDSTTGIIAELDAALPIPALMTEQHEEALRRGARDLFVARGVTHVAEMTETLAGVQALDGLSAAGEIVPRISMALWAPVTLSLDDAVSWRDHFTLAAHPDRVRVRGVKMFTDGGFSARTAAICSPYLDNDGRVTDSFGDLAMSPGTIHDWITRIQAAGLQPFVHTCGERATQVVTDGSASRDPETQVRVEHAGHLFVEREKTFSAMQAAGVRPMPNPAFLNTIGSSLANYADGARGNRFLFRDMLERGFRISGSSDLHVGSHPEQTNPFFMMWCSIARIGFDGTEVDPEQAIGIDDALRMHTTHAAEALGVADTSGSITDGKRADLIVLDRDPRTVSTDQLRDIRVDFTFIDGKCVYERPGAEPARPVGGSS